MQQDVAHGVILRPSDRRGRTDRWAGGSCLWHPVPISVRPVLISRRQEPPMAPAPDAQSAPEEPVVEETLVEEVSIDGMCGVY
ncbi:hypothetical protein GCM10017691_55740 [Pseudonocardia petroleophila]